MAAVPIPVESIERRMRGGAQALLVRAANKKVYVAKCVGNPQGTRTLINEWIVTRLLRLLKVSTPEVHLLQIKRGVPGGDLLEFQTGNRRAPIAEGVHLGSLCPVDPGRAAIFDFLPRHLLSKVVNLPDFVLAYVFDQWVSHADSRQAIFVRERCADKTAKFRAYLIDHGLSFGGSRWELRDTALQGLYSDRSIYTGTDFEAECHGAADRIAQLGDAALISAEREIPAEWLATGDREQMTQLTEGLSRRKESLHDVVDRAVRQLREAQNAIPKLPVGRLLLTILLLLAFVPKVSRLSRSDANIDVKANREVDYSQAPQGRILHVMADGRDLPQGSLVAEVVNEYGRRVWRGKAVLDKQRVETTVPAIGKSGVYFFRVYRRSQGGVPEELLREYVLVVKQN